MKLIKNEQRTLDEGFDVYDLVSSAGQYAGEIHEDGDGRVWMDGVLPIGTVPQLVLDAP